MTKDWQEVPLKAVANPISRLVPVEAGTTYRTLGVKWWGMGAYERESIDGSRTAAKTLSIVREGDLIINKIWVRHGSVAIAGKDVDGCTGSGEFPTFELDLNRIDPRWIHWQTKMKSFWEKCDDLSRGTSGKNRIKPELFLTINIPLPPLTEQRRIVAHIESLAARVNEALRLREEADDATEVLLQSRANQILQEHSGKGIWKWSHLPEFVLPERHSIKRGPFGSHLRKEFFVESGYKVYEQKHAIYGDFSAGRYYIDEEKFQQLKSFAVKPGDIIISCSGTIGKVSIVPDDAMPGIINQALLKLTLDTKKIDKRFFKMVFESDFIKQEVDALSPGSAMKNIGSVKFLKKIKFPLPSLDEQRRIVTYLDGLQAKVNALRELQVKSGEELSALMPSVLDRAFKGEL